MYIIHSIINSTAYIQQALQCSHAHFIKIVIFNKDWINHCIVYFSSIIEQFYVPLQVSVIAKITLYAQWIYRQGHYDKDL